MAHKNILRVVGDEFIKTLCDQTVLRGRHTLFHDIPKVGKTTLGNYLPDTLGNDEHTDACLKR